MRFRRNPQIYGQTPQPETPYQRAGQMWDERIGSARVQAKNWRLMAFGTFFLAGGLAGALVWQSAQSRVVPYIVEVDALGEARAVATASSDYRPTDPQVAWHLGRFISNIRSVSLDPVLMRAHWLAAYDHASERGALFLGEHARAANPFAEIGRRTVAVQVTSVVRASDNSFQVRWTETEYEQGSLSGTSRWTALLTIIIRPPHSAEILRKNPLGLYVDAIDWSRELDLPAEQAANASVTAEPVQAEIPAFVPSGSPLDPAPAVSEEATATSPERNSQ